MKKLLRYLRLRIVVVWAVLALASLGPAALALRDEGLPRTPVGVAYSDLAAASTPVPARPPEVLIGAAATRIATPTPTPLPVTPSPGPEWVVSLRDLSLRPVASASQRDSGQVPRDSFLKVMDVQAGRMRLFYAGDGDQHDAAEGWVGASEVAQAQAPGWVMTLGGAALRAAAGAGGPISEWLLSKTVLEVLEDHRQELRIFHLGDGRARSATDGWVTASDLAPAGSLLAAESRGVRVLTRAQVAELQSGEGVWLAIPYRSQFDGSPAAGANCGPAAVGMVLESLGVPAATGELRALAMRLQGTSGPDVGVAIEFLSSMVEHYGMKAYDLGAGRSSLRRWSLDDVRRHLGLGHPVIAQLRFRQMPGRGESDYNEDHYVVISGMLGEDFIYNDSVDVDGPGYGRLMSAEALGRAWGSSFSPFAAFAVGRP